MSITADELLQSEAIETTAEAIKQQGNVLQPGNYTVALTAVERFGFYRGQNDEPQPWGSFNFRVHEGESSGRQINYNSLFGSRIIALLLQGGFSAAEIKVSFVDSVVESETELPLVPAVFTSLIESATPLFAEVSIKGEDKDYAKEKYVELTGATDIDAAWDLLKQPQFKEARRSIDDDATFKVDSFELQPDGTRASTLVSPLTGREIKAFPYVVRFLN